MRPLAVRTLTRPKAPLTGAKKFITPKDRSAPTQASRARQSQLRGHASRPHSRQPDTLEGFPATWRSGYAAACKAVYTGSIPVVASYEKCLQTAGFRRSDGSGRERAAVKAPHRLP